MTQIQASVSVKDNVDSKIEQKIKAIGLASVTATNQLNNLKNAVSSLSARNINGFSTAVATLGRTNFNNLASQLQNLANVSSRLNGSFSETALQATKLQIAQSRLAQEQTKLSILNTRLQQQQASLANAQDRASITSANLANAQTRANTAIKRNEIASIQAQTAVARLTREQARLEQQTLRNAQASSQASTGMRQFVGAMFALATATTAVMGVAQLGDQYQMMINKLSLVTTSAEQARNRLASLTDVAISSYSDLNSITQLYTRLDMALKQTGGSASEAMQITQTLSKTVSLAGLTTAEAGSALLQISQAFNKGKLDGDEFRTVMETMPPLADAIARQFTKMKGGVEVTRGELLKLAPQGKITGEIMKRAVLEMSEAIDQKFAQLTPTVAMQLQNLQTQAQVYFGAMFKDTGLAEKMGNAIKYIANNLELATTVAVAFATAVAFAGAVKTLSSFITTVNALRTAYVGATGAVAVFNAVTKATPIGWIITGVTVLGIALDKLFDGAIGKSLFPSYDQDKAKADDYISRLKDINSQMDLMSFTKLKQETTLLDQAMDKNNKTIAETETKVKKLQTEITKQENIYNNASEALKRFEKSQFDLLTAQEKAAVNAIGWNSVMEGLTANQTASQQKLIDLNAELTNTTRELDKANENNEQVMRSQLKAYEKQIQHINDAKKAIEGKKEKDILANSELSAQKKIVDESAVYYQTLIGKVNSLRTALRALLGMSADLSAPINETAEQAVDKVKNEAVERIKKETDYMLKYSKASKDVQRAMSIEKSMQKDLASFRDQKTGELTQEGKELLQARIEAQKALDARQEADAKARQTSRKHAKEKESEAKKAENARQKAIEKQEQYVGKLDDELALLKDGYQNYNRYNSLYALRLEMQQKGVTLTEQQMTAIKAKIDAVEREKELAKEINSIEENSLQKQREQQRLKLEALSKAKISETDRKIQTDDIIGGTGAVYGLEQGISKITEQYRLHYELIDQMRLTDFEKEQAINALRKQEAEAIHQKRLENMQAMGGVWEVASNAISSFEQQASNVFTNVLTGTMTMGDAMRNLASTILNEVVKSIVTMGVKWVSQQMTMYAVGEANQASATASAVASGSAITSAMTPAATATAIATQGASVGTGMTALMGAFATIPMLIALAGKRRNGGTVNAGSLYQVGEGNAPEIYQSRSGRQYMIAGDNGRVFSNKQVMGSGGTAVHVTQNVTINGNGQLDADTLSKMREQTRAVIYEVLSDENRAGGMFA